MRLLDKKNINTDFGLQRKMQIDEGVIIAKKVDVLRETLASLDAQHDKFIAGSKQELINVTGSLQERKSLLEGEIRQLEERKRELNKIISEKDAISKKEKDDLTEREMGVTQKEIASTSLFNEIEQTKENIQKTVEEIEELKRVTASETEIARGDREEVETVKNVVIRLKEAHVKESSDMASKLEKKEEEFRNQKHYLDILKQELDRKEKELNEREIAINDKYETLNRTITRLNK